jgi:glutamate-1-semialdehyde 2,1-aminomutase
MNRFKSKEAFEEAKKSLAGGIGSGGRLQHQPFCIERGKGSHVVEFDGNEYIDYMLAFGALTLGHAPEAVIDAIRDRISRGTMYGTGCEEEFLLAERVVQLVPCAELVRFTNSGTESVQAALRLARAYTGRDKVIKFEGHFHGWADNIYISTKPTPPMGLRNAPWKMRETPGQPKNAAENLIILPWNDLEIVGQALRHSSHEIAAIILEPVMFYNGCIEPTTGYLQGLRDMTEKHEVLLIFDEVITGFRLALGGAQEYFGVKPDLCTFAKGFAAGLPIAGFGGRREIMELLSGNTVHHLGTYNSNPLCAAGALAALGELVKDDARALVRIRKLGAELKAGLNKLFKKNGQPMKAVGPDCVFTVISPQLELRDYRDTLKYDLERMKGFYSNMFSRGIWFMARGNFFLSAAHTEKDIEETLEKASLALQG